MNTQMILDYLTELSTNNNREWYHAHKAEYQAANGQFEEPGGQSFLGGGLFTDMFKDATRMVRDYISEHGSEWEAIITAPTFQEHFTVGGSALKNVPAGYEKDHPQAEYLKYKSWYLEYPIQDKDLVDSNLFLAKAADIFRLMKPFNDYLNSALAGFKMPAR